MRLQWHTGGWRAVEDDEGGRQRDIPPPVISSMPSSFPSSDVLDPQSPTRGGGTPSRDHISFLSTSPLRSSPPHTRQYLDFLLSAPPPLNIKPCQPSAAIDSSPLYTQSLHPHASTSLSPLHHSDLELQYKQLKGVLLSSLSQYDTTIHQVKLDKSILMEEIKYFQKKDLENQSRMGDFDNLLNLVLSLNDSIQHLEMDCHHQIGKIHGLTDSIMHCKYQLFAEKMILLAKYFLRESFSKWKFLATESHYHRIIKEMESRQIEEMSAITEKLHVAESKYKLAVNVSLLKNFSPVKKDNVGEVAELRYRLKLANSEKQQLVTNLHSVMAELDELKKRQQLHEGTRTPRSLSAKSGSIDSQLQQRLRSDRHVYDQPSPFFM